jgi:isopentenyldiphosphate isomerase
MEESFDVLNEDGTSAGFAKQRKMVHRDGDWHSCAHIWVVNPTSDLILLQRRVHTKDSWGNYYDVSCAGHLSAGDTPLAAAERELDEELGISANGELEYIATLPQRHTLHNGTFVDREWAHCYVLRRAVSSEELSLQQSEVSGTRWVTRTELLQMYTRAAAEHVHEDGVPTDRLMPGASAEEQVVPLDCLERYTKEVLGRL